MSGDCGHWELKAIHLQLLSAVVSAPRRDKPCFIGKAPFWQHIPVFLSLLEITKRTLPKSLEKTPPWASMLMSWAATSVAAWNTTCSGTCQNRASCLLVARTADCSTLSVRMLVKLDACRNRSFARVSVGRGQHRRCGRTAPRVRLTVVAALARPSVLWASA